MSPTRKIVDEFPTKYSRSKSRWLISNDVDQFPTALTNFQHPCISFFPFNEIFRRINELFIALILRQLLCYFVVHLKLVFSSVRNCLSTFSSEWVLSFAGPNYYHYNRFGLRWLLFELFFHRSVTLFCFNWRQLFGLLF